MMILLFAFPAFPVFSQPTLHVSEWLGQVQVDGKLEEPCYQLSPIVDQFVIAGQPHTVPQKTKAWLFWRTNQLIFAFECEDQDIVAAAPSSMEHDVDHQDRVEIFLWSGRKKDPYICIEIGALGAVHDYRARFYRQFDDAWSLSDGQCSVMRNHTGYTVEGVLPSAMLNSQGFRLKPGTQWRVGLFRADFSAQNPQGEPFWITWVDAKGPKPDFHVAGSFGKMVLKPALTQRKTRR